MDNNEFVDLSKTEEQSGTKAKNVHQELDYKSYGFTEADLNKEFYLFPQILTVN